MKHAISKLLREPLLIFLVLGALLFGLHTLVNDQSPETETAVRIQVAAADVDQLRGGWERQMVRPAQPVERQGLIDGFIQEEVLAREALALGLDRYVSYICSSVDRHFYRARGIQLSRAALRRAGSQHERDSPS